jgi:serine/threonine kinase 38
VGTPDYIAPEVFG